MGGPGRAEPRGIAPPPENPTSTPGGAVPFHTVRGKDDATVDMPLPPGERHRNQGHPDDRARTRPHRPGRPHWRCTACGAPYPCGPARLTLLTEYAGDRLGLAVHLATTMLDAVDDTYRLGARPDTSNLHARFLGWLTRRPTSTRDRHTSMDAQSGQGTECD